MKKRILTVPAKDDSFLEVQAFAEDTMAEYGCPVKIRTKMMICIEEMVVNVFHYAYPKDQDAENAMLTVEMWTENGILGITLIDSGIPYNPLEKEDPDITLSAEERQIGGLGIFMVKKKMDKVDYRYEDGKNIFTMSKKM